MSKKMLAEVKRIGTNGVSVELENGQRAWLPEYEITLDSEEDIDLEKEYPVGSKAWKRFAARAAHRMGTRLADFAGGLTFLSEILTSEERQDETRELLEDMETAVYGMQAIIDQFKEFVNPREMHFGCADVNELIQKLMATIRREKNVELQLDLQDNLPRINADKNALFDVFREIVANAINAQEEQDAVEEKIKIAVHTTCSSTAGATCREVQIEFANPGQGIPPENKGKIFEPFFSTRAQGSGLGLAIAQEIIEEHGGSIEEIGGYGKEARFVIRLPVPSQKEV